MKKKKTADTTTTIVGRSLVLDAATQSVFLFSREPDSETPTQQPRFITLSPPHVL